MSQALLRKTTGSAACVGLVLALGACNLGQMASSCLFPKKMLWAHKGGIHPGTPPNSVEAVRKSLAAGFQGVEIDAMYDEPTDDLVVSHDFPYQTINGQLLTLDELLAQTFAGQRYYLWLDAKNLGDANAVAYGNALERLSRKYPLADWMVVESRSVVANEVLYGAGFKVLTGAYIDVRDQAHAQSYAHGVAHAIVDFELDEGAYDLGNLPLFLFGSATPGQAKLMLDHPAVCVVLSENSSPNER